MKKKKITFFYRNGEIHEIIQEASDEEFEEIAEIINVSFLEGVDAVLRLNDETVANFIRVSDVLRVTFEKMN